MRPRLLTNSQDGKEPEVMSRKPSHSRGGHQLLAPCPRDRHTTLSASTHHPSATERSARRLGVCDFDDNDNHYHHHQQQGGGDDGDDDGGHAADNQHHTQPDGHDPLPLSSSPNAPFITTTTTTRLPPNPRADVHTRSTLSTSTSPTASPTELRLAAHLNPGKRAAPDPALDDLRAVVTADAVREEVHADEPLLHHVHRQPRTVARTVLDKLPERMPGQKLHKFAPISTTTTTTSSSSSPSSTNTMPPPLSTRDQRPIMPRAGSIDSTTSSVSTNTNPSFRPGPFRVSSSEAAPAPQDAVSLIAAAGSPEVALQKLINEKNAAASQTAQLWRLVEKQRSMILGLNRDLEKSLKEKERYRKKLKDHLVSSNSAPALTSGTSDDIALDRDNSQSPPPSAERARAIAHPTIRDASSGSRKVSDASDATSSAALPRSDTPQDPANASASAISSTPQSAGSLISTAKEASHQPQATSSRLASKVPPVLPLNKDPAAATPVPPSHATNATSPPASAASFSGFKNASRKAPPAPLDLSPRTTQPAVSRNIAADNESESEYEDDPESARAEQMDRGRRKTREDDDREREALVRKEEEEARSRSKKNKSKSNSKSQPPQESAEKSHDTTSQQPTSQTTKPAFPSDMADPAAILRQRAAPDAINVAASNTLPRNISAPVILSPGLPMSPRPADRPMNSPMPRAPNKAVNSIPMSPRAGLPLSPRPPKGPIPLPPQTPLTFASPHLARAEQYQQQAQPLPNSTNPAVKISPEPSPDKERVSVSSDAQSRSEVYTGFVTEQYPDYLLPPNALPSIIVKTASSRMKPSRQSYIAPNPKNVDENPVFTIAVHQRSDRRQLWRAEKTLNALAGLDYQVKSGSNFRDRLPDKTLFVGHAPAKMDARRSALDSYFERMLDSIVEEKVAEIVCKFLSTGAFAAEGGNFFTPPAEAPGSPVMAVMSKGRPRREGYLTKRGKNFGGWKARYFVLDGPALKYFEAPGGAHLGLIKLQNAQIGKQSPASGNNAADDEDNQFRHAFLILEPKRKDSSSLVRHVLCAESDEERDLWVEALLHYVDYRDDGEEVGRGIPIVNGPRSPRLQKSMNELTPPTAAHDGNSLRPADALRSVGYDQMKAGDAPVMGGKGAETLHDASYPQISGPSNAHVIQNAGDWGMKAPPTPGAQQKDSKKRGLFSFRGRSSSDLAPGTPGPMPENMSTPRPVFGVPLAEAVRYAQPAGILTELPAVVYRCIEYLTENDAIAEEGIFRLSGSNTVIKGLRDRFNNEGDVNLVADGKYYDIHAVASLLKLYLRELPASILTRELHLDFLKCLELGEREKISSLNVLVHRLPAPNRALLAVLSGFLLSIVSNADMNKMNVRNVGIVFAPTLNVPGPLISCFVEDQAEIFGDAVDPADSPISNEDSAPASLPTDLRSPRKQMFSDLPTPAYNQTQFQSLGGLSHGSGITNDTGMIPMQPTYTEYQMAPQGDGGYGSLNDALRSPALPNTTSSGCNGLMVPRDVKAKRRESSMLMMNMNMNNNNNDTSGTPGKQPIMQGLREED